MANSNTLSAQRAKKYLRQLGWTNNQAAGLVGNFQQESGVNLDPSIVSPDGTSYGIAQWTATRQNLYQSTYGKPIQGSTLTQQLDFVNYELNTTEKAAGNALRKATTPGEAALIVSNLYERPAASAANNIQRISYADSAAQTPTDVAAIDGLSAEEKNNLNNQQPSEEGEAFQERLQREADKEFGQGRVEVGQPTFVINNDDPNAEKPTSSNPDTAKITTPLPNRLKEYPSYIYGLSLHLLSDSDYNETVRTQTYTPKNVLVASAGKYSSSFPRNKFFNEDFYFDNLNLTTTISPSNYSRNTNAIDGEFTLLEPHGFTLVERLLQAALDIKSQNYLDMPYLLQIDFFAMNDAGDIVGGLENLRKRIPIKIIKMDINLTVRGAEYKIKYVPFNHTAYDTSACSTPANFEITAKTISEFFQSTEGTLADDLAAENAVQAQSQREQGLTKDPAAPPTDSAGASIRRAANVLRKAVGITPKSPQNKTAQPSKISYTRVRSYGTAINAWNQVLYKYNKISVPDSYRFEFPRVTLDDGTTISIGDSPFTDQLRHTPKGTKMIDNLTPGDVATMYKSNLGQTTEKGSNRFASRGINLYDTNQATFQVQAGTTIERLLDYIIRNSDYIQDQLIVPEEPDYEAKKLALKDKPLYWFKIIPTIILDNFDSIRKCWARKITYSVVPYKIYNVRLDVGPQGVIRYPTKIYNYIYTGLNDDILDLDIRFNTLFFNQVTAFRNSLALLNPTANSAVDDGLYPNYNSYRGGGSANTADYNSVMPMALKPVVQNSRAAATGGASTPKETAAIDLEASLMTNSDADMLNVKLKIIGDPDYVKQDDVFYRPPLEGTNVAVVPSSDPRILPNNGSLVMDQGGLYVQLLFRVPTDLDETTGLMKFDSKYKYSLFSGMYIIQKVTNNFAQGRFTQELDLVRLPRQQAFDYVTSRSSNSDNRAEQASGIQPSGYDPGKLITGGPPDSVTKESDAGTGSKPGGEQPAAEAANSEPNAESQRTKDLRAVNDTAPTDTVNATNQSPTTSTLGVEPATVTRLPDGVTQDPMTGNYTYKGLVIPADPGTSQFNQYVTAVDNKQTIQVTQIDNVSGNPITRTFDGNYTQAAVERAQNNVTFAERELARFENKVRTDPEFQNLNAEQQTNLNVSLARRQTEVAAAKSTLEQAKSGKYTE